MAREVVRTIDDEAGRGRLIIFRRDDGSFGFEDLRWVDEGCWAPRGGYSQSYCTSAEHALREARGRVNWLMTPTDAAG